MRSHLNTVPQQSIPRHDPQFSDQNAVKNQGQIAQMKKKPDNQQEGLPPGVFVPYSMRSSPQFMDIMEKMGRTKTFQNITHRFAAGQQNLIMDIQSLKKVKNGKVVSNPFAHAPRATATKEGLTGLTVEASSDNLFMESSKQKGVYNATADPTFIAKVLMHEAKHQQYNLGMTHDGVANYPTLDKNTTKEQNGDFVLDAKGNKIPIGKDKHGNIRYQTYEGDHETMAEGAVPEFVKGMKEFDAQNGTSHSETWYQAMAWYGSVARATQTYQNVPEATRKKYEAIMDNESRYMTYMRAKQKHKESKSAADEAAMEAARKNVNWTLFTQTRTK